MVTSLHLNLLHHLRRCKPLYSSRALPLLLRSKPTKLASKRLFSTPAKPYPLQYEMIIACPANASHPPPPPPSAVSTPQSDSEITFNEWVDKKLSTKETDNINPQLSMDKSKRKYYNKRRKRMYRESESDEEGSSDRRGGHNDFIELKQEVVELLIRALASNCEQYQALSQQIVLARILRRDFGDHAH